MTAQSYERKVGDSHGLKKAYLGFQLGRVLEKEGKYCKEADRVFNFNQKDKRLIEEKYHVQNCQVLNPYYGIEDDVVGNDVAESRMTKSKGIKAADPETGTQPYTLCFLGQMGRDENYQAAMRLITIAERVKKQIPQLQIYIVGNRPPEKLKQKENQWIKLELQLRTAAMDYWANLDHQLRYKRGQKQTAVINEELQQCASVITQLDQKMLDIRKKIDKI